MHLLEKALALALDAHKGQVDKAGKPYILHPVRLMLALETEDEMAAALLHDVLEDSDYTAEDLKAEGIPEKVIQIVEYLTRAEGESYDDFIRRVSGNRLATRVKMKDLEDNMNLLRIDTIKKKDLERIERYHRALKDLRSCLLNYESE